MIGIIRNQATHADKLERWLGVEHIERISHSMKTWYGPPIALGGVPGAVYAHRGGDFRGPIDNHFSNAIDYAVVRLNGKLKRFLHKQMSKSHVGFSSVGDLLSEFAAGKHMYFTFNKVGTTGVVGVTNTLWFVGAMPAAGAAGGAAPGGTAWTSASTGAFPFTNPGGTDTHHFLRADPRADFVNTLLLYDRLFSVTKTMNSSATEAVTGVPTRYTSATANAQDSAAGNFLIIETRAALAATAHNWTVVTYTDESGNTGATLPSVVGNSGAIVNRLDQPVGTWFNPLATGDTGIKALTQMQASALVATGNIDFTIGHPIAFIPIPIVNMIMPIDGLRSALNLERVFDNACLSLLELTKPATSATTYTGSFETIYG